VSKHVQVKLLAIATAVAQRNGLGPLPELECEVDRGALSRRPNRRAGRPGTALSTSPGH
jgi:hypothetical protein